jgi:hypothetical protein
LNTPPNDFTHLWNDLPDDERNRLFPYMIENQILIIWQSKEKAIRAHRAHMREIDRHIENLEHELNKFKK